MEAFGALCTSPDFMEYPEDSMRPFDVERAGTVISDGGTAFIVQSEKFWNENLDQNGQRDRVYAELAGFAENCDAFHILRPT